MHCFKLNQLIKEVNAFMRLTPYYLYIYLYVNFSSLRYQSSIKRFNLNQWGFFGLQVNTTGGRSEAGKTRLLPQLIFHFNFSHKFPCIIFLMCLIHKIRVWCLGHCWPDYFLMHYIYLSNMMLYITLNDSIKLSVVFHRIFR